MKKIKNLIIMYPSFERGGATVNLINFVNTCAQHNIKIQLITDIKKIDKKKFIKKNIKFIIVENKKNYKILNRLVTSVKSIFLLVNLFKKIDNKDSIVISFQSHILPIIFSRIFGRKIVIRNSEDIIDATKYADHKFSAILIFLLKLFFYNLSSGVITNSNKAKSSLDKIIFNKKTQLIYNPYLKEVLNKKNDKRNNLILSVGRLCKQKNQTIAIKAFAIFLKKFPNYKLVLIGHGNDYKKLKDLCLSLNIIESIIFKGWVSDPKKYYLKSKILIFPSLYEGLPNTLIEAVNYDLPCISSKCSGASDILTEKYGSFVPRYNYEILAKKMIYVTRNYKKTLSDNREIKKKLSRFLIKPQVLKYLNFCNNLLN
ncbi:glycosyltransferase [bacterium]|nr:glycosyltransferase [bacterium]